MSDRLRLKLYQDVKFSSGSGSKFNYQLLDDYQTS